VREVSQALSQRHSAGLWRLSLRCHGCLASLGHPERADNTGGPPHPLFTPTPATSGYQARSCAARQPTPLSPLLPRLPFSTVVGGTPVAEVEPKPDGWEVP
jgi:hypothetical protein